LDLVRHARRSLPLDVVGIGAEAVGGIGEVRRADLPAFSARYRFFFHPVRYTSFGMAVCEAMMIGMPIVALATTEMPTVLENGRSGIIHTDPERLIEGARQLLVDPHEARRLGAAGREIARERFAIDRFVRDWSQVFDEVIGRWGGRPAGRRATSPRTEVAPARAPEEVRA